MWNTIPVGNIKNSIWEKLNDEKVDLDINFIEENFEKPAVATKALPNSGMAGMAGSVKAAV